MAVERGWGKGLVAASDASLLLWGRTGAEPTSVAGSQFAKMGEWAGEEGARVILAVGIGLTPVCWTSKERLAAAGGFFSSSAARSPLQMLRSC
jgi:hypothetical protein